MAITFRCGCGRQLHARPEFAGRKTKCPACQAVLTIPAAAPAAVAVGAGNDFAGSGEVESQPLSDAAIPADDAMSPLPTMSPRIEVTAGLTDPSSAAVEDGPLPDGAKQYKLLTPKDMGFIAKFDAVKLEEQLNRLARQGWTVKSAVTLNLPGPTGMHEELVMILEK